MTPRKAVTAHVLLPRDLHTSMALDDDAIATDLDANRLQTKPFVPLPVLGVPGWCDENTAASFYADTQVFRPLPAPAKR